jgi:streptomycin 6-kinase
MNSLDIVNDVRQVCLSDNKMTEKERIAVILGIRPKLRLMNQKLRRLTRAIKYTSLADVWAEIDYNAREGADKLSVSRQCMERWKRNGKR